MKDEIKEIDVLLNYMKNKDGYTYSDDINSKEKIKYFYKDEIKVLLDYITNLQERFDALLEAHKIADELETEYQERNEKAIELLEPLIELNGTMTASGMNKLLNILQGENKDE